MSDPYNIDKSKYFYLCLMLKYYIDVNYTNTYTITPTHIEVIKKFIDKLSIFGILGVIKVHTQK